MGKHLNLQKIRSKGGSVRAHLPCRDCGSSDALADYPDHTYCFSCGSYKNKKTKELMSVSTSLQYIPWRGISKETMSFFGVKTRVKDDGIPYSVLLDYGSGAYKERLVASKEFFAHGAMNDRSLFARDRFPTGQSKYITIVEGELDALSCYQMLGSKYPVVSVRSASSARRDCEAEYEYLNGYERIYLCFDNDGPGRKATQEVGSLFDVNKIYHVKLERKDATEYLEQNATTEFNRVWWAAKPYLPKGILAAYDDIESVLRKDPEQTVGTYPWPTLDTMAYGIRSKEFVLLTAQEKVGKTTTLRAIEHHLLKTTDHNVGVIHLEESEKHATQGLVSIELRTPVYLPDSPVSVDDQVGAYKALTRRDNRLHFYTHFGSDDPNTILDVIRYLVAVAHCKFIFLDHLTMLVSGFEEEDERRKLDYLSTRLAMMTRDLDFTLFLVSHVNDNGQPRGSRMPAKVCDLHVFLSRDKETADEHTRNKINVLVRDNRFGGTTGPAGTLAFDPKSYTLKELVHVPSEVDVF